ncbi:MAG: rod shape-determining protein MreC [Oligosphaeraceae bacterium]
MTSPEEKASARPQGVLTVRLLTLLSFLLCAAALFLLPAGTTRRILHTGMLFTQPAQELHAMGQRVSREALGGLPENMTLEERDALLAELAQARMQLSNVQGQQEGLRLENLQLQRLLRHYKQPKDYSLVVAEVTGRGLFLGKLNTFLLDRGASDGIQEGQAVLSVDGVVGVVAHATARQSVVKLLCARDFSLAAEATLRKTSGILENRDGSLVLAGTMGESFDSLGFGEWLYTTDLGNDAVQPGLPVGVIQGKDRAPDDSPVYAITPAVKDFLGIQYVMVAIRGKR